MGERPCNNNLIDFDGKYDIIGKEPYGQVNSPVYSNSNSSGERPCESVIYPVLNENVQLKVSNTIKKELKKSRKVKNKDYYKEITMVQNCKNDKNALVLKIK